MINHHEDTKRPKSEFPILIDFRQLVIDFREQVALADREMKALLGWVYVLGGIAIGEAIVIGLLVLMVKGVL